VSDAVLLSYHGSVADLGDMPGFLRNIRRGRPVPDDLLQEVLHRYRHIGGSPLIEQSRAQAALLEARLGIPVRSAGRLWHPYPSEVLGELAALGATRIVSLPLAPQSVDVYHQAVRDALAALPEPRPSLVCVPAWGLEPLLIDAFVETVEEGLAKLGPAKATEVGVLLTAHSLPVRVIQSGDRYEAQFREMAAAIAEVLSRRGHTVDVAFQSQGASAEPWLGPDLAAGFAGFLGRGIDSVLIAPVGFLAEHVETLYDLDVEAVKTAEAAGVKRYARAPAVATRTKLIDALEAVARRALSV
jgi:ferrochelatase